MEGAFAGKHLVDNGPEGEDVGAMVDFGLAKLMQSQQDCDGNAPTQTAGTDPGIGLGYDLLRAKKITEAIEIFKLGVEADPAYFNTWDSLADAYLAHEDKDLAVKNYRKALELNPNDTNAVERLRQLGAKP